MTHHIVVMWDDIGLECVIDYTIIEQRRILDILADKIPSATPSIRNLLLRARYNNQRNYEIWAVGSSMTDDEIIKQWNKNPEATKQAIRNVGECIFNNGLIENG